ncbi:Aquaporin-4 [Schistosoma japonicum]|nr:Aquaporin-4 [Schistosoma japonicum]
MLLHRIRMKLQQMNKPLFNAYLGEFISTFILITFGLGTMIQHKLNYKLKDDSTLHYISISTGWSIAFLLSQTIVSPFGYGLMNPAVTLSLALIGKLPLKYVLPFTIIQLTSSFLSSLMLYFTYYEIIITNHSAKVCASDNHIQHTNSSVLFNQFMVTPSASHYICFIDRLFLTAFTTIFILLIRDERNYNLQQCYRSIYVAIFTAGRIGALSMNAGTSINPVRDLGPRIVIALCRLGMDAFKKDNYYFWIPTVASYLGSIIGAVLYELTIGAHLNKKLTDKLHQTIKIPQSQLSSLTNSSSYTFNR